MAGNFSHVDVFIKNSRVIDLVLVPLVDYQEPAMTGNLWTHVPLNAKYIMKSILTYLWVNLSFPTNCVFLPFLPQFFSR